VCTLISTSFASGSRLVGCWAEEHLCTVWGGGGAGGGGVALNTQCKLCVQSMIYPMSLRLGNSCAF